MPTDRPRYTVTDTGETADVLDLAARAWPDVVDRRRLLLRLTALGGEALRDRLDTQVERERRQRVALGRARELVDEDVLLDDRAWR